MSGYSSGLRRGRHTVRAGEGSADQARDAGVVRAYYKIREGRVASASSRWSRPSARPATSRCSVALSGATPHRRGNRSSGPCNAGPCPASAHSCFPASAQTDDDTVARSAAKPRFQVVDGDTVKFGSQLVRLFGIDASAGQTCDDRQWHPGPLAKKALEDFIRGRPVTCKQVDYDVRNNRPVGNASRRTMTCKR